MNSIDDRLSGFGLVLAWIGLSMATGLMAGFMPYRADILRRLTPQHLWMLDYPTTRLK